MFFKDSDIPEKRSQVEEAARFKAMPFYAKLIYPYYYFWMLPKAAKATTSADLAMLPQSR